MLFFSLIMGTKCHLLYGIALLIYLLMPTIKGVGDMLHVFMAKQDSGNKILVVDFKP